MPSFERVGRGYWRASALRDTVLPEPGLPEPGLPESGVPESGSEADVNVSVSFTCRSFCSSRRISCSRVFCNSVEARLNSLRLRPSDLPSSGSFRGAKNDERDHQNDDQLGHADRTKHGGRSLTLSIETACAIGQGIRPLEIPGNHCGNRF